MSPVVMFVVTPQIGLNPFCINVLRRFPWHGREKRGE